jgi:hypothetical protein
MGDTDSLGISSQEYQVTEGVDWGVMEAEEWENMDASEKASRVRPPISSRGLDAELVPVNIRLDDVVALHGTPLRCSFATHLARANP